MKIFMIKKGSPILKKLKSRVPVSNGDIVTLNDEEMESYKNDLKAVELDSPADIILHAKALACHCECLGFNAANMVAAMADVRVPYPEEAYFQAMQKWGLVDKNGKPTFID